MLLFTLSGGKLRLRGGADALRPLRKARAAPTALWHQASSLHPPHLAGEIPSSVHSLGPAGRGGGSVPHCSGGRGAWRGGVPSHQHTSPSRSPQHSPGLVNTQLRKGSWDPAWQTSRSRRFSRAALCALQRKARSERGTRQALSGVLMPSSALKNILVSTTRPGLGKTS